MRHKEDVPLQGECLHKVFVNNLETLLSKASFISQENKFNRLIINHFERRCKWTNNE